MRLKDLLKYIEKHNIPEETVLDGISFVDYMSSYYDGYPKEIKSGNIHYVNEMKLRFYETDYETVIWDNLDRTLSKEENLKKCLSNFTFSENFPKEKKLQYIQRFQTNFEECWLAFSE